MFNGDSGARSPQLNARARRVLKKQLSTAKPGSLAYTSAAFVLAMAGAEVDRNTDRMAQAFTSWDSPGRAPKANDAAVLPLPDALCRLYAKWRRQHTIAVLMDLKGDGQVEENLVDDIVSILERRPGALLAAADRSRTRLMRLADRLAFQVSDGGEEKAGINRALKIALSSRDRRAVVAARTCVSPDYS